MMAERQIQSLGKSKVFAFIFAVIIGLFLCGSAIFAAETSSDDVRPGPARYMSRSLKHIPAEQGRKYLAEAGVGTVSQLPNTNMLLITGKPRDLVKANAILRLVDTKQQFVVKTISPVSQAANLPPIRRITAEVGDISIGTFSNPPLDTTKPRAIIDIHNTAVIAIAPTDKIEKIIAAIDQFQKTTEKPADKPVQLLAKETVERRIEKPPAPKVAQTVEPSAEPEKVVKTELEKIDLVGQPPARPGKQEKESDELFDKLLSSLAEAEEKMAQLQQTGVKPKQAEPTEPPIAFEQPVTEPQQALQETKQPQEAELAALIEKLVAEEVAKRLAPEIPQELALKEPLVAPVEPSEVVEPNVPVTMLYQPKVITNGNEMLDLNLPEKLEIALLLSLVGDYLQLDYLYDPAKIKGVVTLNLRGPIKVKDLYPLLESVLKFHGFVMTRKLDLVTIVPAAEAHNIDPVMIDAEKGQPEVGDIIISRIFELKHIDAASAKNLLTGMRLGVDINTSASGVGVLIVTGYAYRMERVEKLLNMVDKPGEPKEFRFRQLRYTMAATLAPKVKTLAEQLGTVSITVSAAPGAPARPITRKRGESAAAFKARQARASRTRTPTPTATPTAAAPTVYLDADERTNRVLMIGLGGQLDIVEGLIDTLDVEQQDLRTLRLYDIQNVGAEEVLQKLGEIGVTSSAPRTSRTGSRITSRPTTPAGKRPATPTQRSGTTTQEALTEEPQVVVIESTNSLLVNATAEQHAQVAVIIGYVDNETLELAIPYVIYPLENQKPEDLAGVLDQLIQETVKDKEGKIEQVVKKQDDIVIVPDENTFSIIVYASKKNQEWIGNLIKTLDKRRPQVLIDVTLVEVSRTDLFDLDLELASKFPSMAAGGTMDVVGKVVTPFLSQTSTEAYSSPIDGVAQGFYSDRHIQALLTAMQSKSYGRVLAKPKILVNDGQSGTIQTTKTTNVKLSTTNVVPDAGSITAVQYDAYNAGITLTITPNISEGDLLLLEVQLDRSDFLPPPEDGAPPDTTASNINTIVTVPNDRTIILGGLVKLNQTRGGSKVPILGDIPLLGGLFRSASNSAIDSKLYVFVKANILRPDETLTGLPELERISARNAAAFEKFEEKFQRYQDWPGIEPEPMDPLKVLEAE